MMLLRTLLATKEGRAQVARELVVACFNKEGAELQTPTHGEISNYDLVLDIRRSRETDSKVTLYFKFPLSEESLIEHTQIGRPLIPIEEKAARGIFFELDTLRGTLGRAQAKNTEYLEELRRYRRGEEPAEELADEHARLVDQLVGSLGEYFLGDESDIDCDEIVHAVEQLKSRVDTEFAYMDIVRGVLGTYYQHSPGASIRDDVLISIRKLMDKIGELEAESKDFGEQIEDFIDKGLDNDEIAKRLGQEGNEIVVDLIALVRERSPK